MFGAGDETSPLNSDGCYEERTCPHLLVCPSSWKSFHLFHKLRSAEMKSRFAAFVFPAQFLIFLTFFLYFNDVQLQIAALGRTNGDIIRCFVYLISTTIVWKLTTLGDSLA